MRPFSVTVEILPPRPVSVGESIIAGAYASYYVDAADGDLAAARAIEEVREDARFRRLCAAGGPAPAIRVDRIHSIDALPEPLVQPGWVYYPPDQ
jgi:hypothetical protein